MNTALEIAAFAAVDPSPRSAVLNLPVDLVPPVNWEIRLVRVSLHDQYKAGSLATESRMLLCRRGRWGELACSGPQTARRAPHGAQVGPPLSWIVRENEVAVTFDDAGFGEATGR